MTRMAIPSNTAIPDSIIDTSLYLLQIHKGHSIMIYYDASSIFMCLGGTPYLPPRNYEVLW